MSQSPPTESTLQTVGGRYTFDPGDVLGTGGVATVYRGRDLKLRRTVAIKALRAEYLDSVESRRRFRQEARMLRFAEHPNFATIYDHVDQPDGSWIVMELVPGENLKQIVERDGPLPVEEVVRILLKLADALGHLHARGVVHLDLKPQNIVMTADNMPRLIDFGVAQPSGQVQERVDGFAYGTAAYLSPEQAKGERLDQRSDVYSLGCVVYELLTGRTPFVVPDGPNQKQDLIQKHIGTVPAALSTYREDLPAWVDQVVLRAIAKSPGQRYKSVEAFAAAAVAGLERQPAPAPVDGTSRLPGDPDFGSEDEFDDEEMEDTPGRSFRRGLWELGGRAAKRSRPVQGRLWRFATILAIGNLILLLSLLYRQGGNAVLDPVFGWSPGTSATVTTDWLNVRESPSVDAGVAALLGNGVDLTITGMPERQDDTWWWPVSVDTSQGEVSGWVWEDGIEVSGMMWVISAPSRAVSMIGDWLDTAWDWLPVGAIRGRGFALA
jgi:serine/threonine protein kinase